MDADGRNVLIAAVSAGKADIVKYLITEVRNHFMVGVFDTAVVKTFKHLSTKGLEARTSDPPVTSMVDINSPPPL